MAIIVAVFALFVAIAILRKSLAVVPAGHVYLIERLGKFHRCLHPGVSVLVPFVDMIRFRCQTAELLLDNLQFQAVTSDGVKVQVNARLDFRIEDPVNASYEVADFRTALAQLLHRTAEAEIARHDLSYALVERESLTQVIVRDLARPAKGLGIEVLRVAIGSVTPPPEIVAAIERQAASEAKLREELLRQKLGQE